MRRTQLYLDEALWQVLHARAQHQKTTVSELVRRAVREQYLGGRDQRRKAMDDFVGVRKDSPASLDTSRYVRQLRRGTRFDRLKG